MAVLSGSDMQTHICETKSKRKEKKKKEKKKKKTVRDDA